MHELFQLSGSGLGIVQKQTNLCHKKRQKNESFTGTKNRNGHSDEKKGLFYAKKSQYRNRKWIIQGKAHRSVGF